LNDEQMPRLRATLRDLGLGSELVERFDGRGTAVIELPDGHHLVHLGVPMDGSELTEEDWAEVPRACGRAMGCDASAILLHRERGSGSILIHGAEESLDNMNWRILGTLHVGTRIGVLAGHYMLGQDDILLTWLGSDGQLLRQELHHYESGG
jgi:hypothetical protein